MCIDKILVESFVKATEMGAYGASLYKGKGNKVAADQAAVDGMRKELNKINMKGRIVIGEGEMDEAPMLYINEKVGNNSGEELDIAVDPLEGTNFTAKNLPNALSVIAVAKKGNILHAPDIYMEKIAIGSNLPKNLVDLDFDIKKNIKLLAEAKNTSVEKITACVLDRPRHKGIIDSLNSIGTKIKFITDGDVSGVISVAYPKSSIDIYIGVGGAPEGVLAASALDCLNCQMQTRLVFDTSKKKERAKKLGINDLNKKYGINDMIKGDTIFCATGVTDGDLLNGIKNHKTFFEAETLVLHKNSGTNKKIKNKINK